MKYFWCLFLAWTLVAATAWGYPIFGKNQPREYKFPNRYPYSRANPYFSGANYPGKYTDHAPITPTSPILRDRYGDVRAKVGWDASGPYYRLQRKNGSYGPIVRGYAPGKW